MDILTKVLECDIEQKIRAGAATMTWRPHFEQWVQGRIWQERYKEPVIDNLNRYVPNLDRKVILDLGCGMGGLVVRARQEWLSAFGIDYCFDYCVIAKLRGMRYGIQTPVINAQGEFIPLKDQSVDVILCYEVIEHVFDPAALLLEMRRVLRPRGVISMSVPNRWALYDHHYHLWMINYVPRSVAEMLIRLTRRDKGNDMSAGVQRLSDMHYFSFHRFLTLCRRVGFIPSDIREEKLVNGDIERISPKIRFLIGLLRRLRLLRLAYSFWRCTVTDAWHFMLAAKL